jgi:hypothetical protein
MFDGRFALKSRVQKDADGNSFLPPLPPCTTIVRDPKRQGLGVLLRNFGMLVKEGLRLERCAERIDFSVLFGIMRRQPAFRRLKNRGIGPSKIFFVSNKATSALMPGDGPSGIEASSRSRCGSQKRAWRWTRWSSGRTRCRLDEGARACVSV